MHTVYLVCLIAGFLLAIVLAGAGGLHLGAGDHTAHAHAGHAHAGHDAGGQHVDGPGAAAQSVLNTVLGFASPIVLAGAALLFGGVGLIAGSGTLGLILAVIAAVIGGIALRLFLGALVQSSTVPLSLTGEGAIATVNVSIRPGSSGEVVYTLEGLHRSAIARSEIGVALPRGTQVVITRREGGIAWVSPLDPLDEAPVGTDAVERKERL